jgi:hypothetical protein
MRNAIRNGAVGTLLCMTAAACTTGQDSQPAQPVHFSCQDGPNMSVRFGPGTAVLEAGDTNVAMLQTRTADGFRYAGGGQSIRGKGNELHWHDKRGRDLLCHAVPESR